MCLHTSLVTLEALAFDSRLLIQKKRFRRGSIWFPPTITSHVTVLPVLSRHASPAIRSRASPLRFRTTCSKSSRLPRQWVSTRPLPMFSNNTASRNAEKAKKRNPRAALDPLASAAQSVAASATSKFGMVSRALLAPFTSHRHGESNKLLSNCVSLFALELLDP